MRKEKESLARHSLKRDEAFDRVHRNPLFKREREAEVPWGILVVPAEMRSCERAGARKVRCRGAVERCGGPLRRCNVWRYLQRLFVPRFVRPSPAVGTPDPPRMERCNLYRPGPIADM